MKLEVNLYDKINDKDLKYAVIMARYNNKWIFCKHRERETHEIPGGYREYNENILDTARLQDVNWKKRQGRLILISTYYGHFLY